MSEQELMEQLRTNMDTTVHTGELPPLDLYMDQVLALLEERFQAGEKTITKTIINNYSKARLLQKPVGKKYTPEHLLVITLDPRRSSRACRWRRSDGSLLPVRSFPPKMGTRPKRSMPGLRPLSG